MPEDLDTGQIKEWRSIVTLIVFVVTNIIVLFPFHLTIYVPRLISDAVLDALGAMQVIAPRQEHFACGFQDDETSKPKWFVRLRLHLNFVTAPLIADLFLLAISAIGRQEVHDGTIGANNISPIDIMLFFLSLAYIAISIDASGLIRFLAFKVLQWGGGVGHRLFFYLYAFFFGLAAFIGNDPIILSGTAFLAYMTRVSSNIEHPRAWIFTQFALANIASAILVSSNPTNLVLAGAFDIKFIDYTANMIVPVVVTAIVLFPFLLYIIFVGESLIPSKIIMHQLPDEVRQKKPVNPNIPHAKGKVEEEEKDHTNDDEGKLLSLEEIMNPFVDRIGAAFGAIIMATTLITLLALDAASARIGKHAVFWVTLPAAFVMFCWDVTFGWWHCEDTRRIAQEGRKEVEYARVEREIKERDAKRGSPERENTNRESALTRTVLPEIQIQSQPDVDECNKDIEKDDRKSTSEHIERLPAPATCGYELEDLSGSSSSGQTDLDMRVKLELERRKVERARRPRTLVSRVANAYRWSQETFPTATAVLAHLPYALVPFAFSMFVLVQALVTKGWVPVFAYGWDHWVNKTGTVGSVGGMGFLSVVLCNFAGTNIGTTILLSRVIQAWQEIHRVNGIPISNRTFWATVYSMALGVNYGAFSAAFSASLAGLLWRDILARKHIHAHSLDFASVNLPIIAICMTVGCAVLLGEIYIMRDESPYDLP
ncbi:arsenite efflux transporter [Diplodia corticola]|uniref:Arsenite efflux transporter n=1 Tax=Diplodia corticola TaxID=236234 RepID=A0A1J9SL42_9PEZI|nr:arsenite efflux transporter [Diplodia corticola]OJD40341.1 arsenite efflux transporter [Diplodia corticola]